MANEKLVQGQTHLLLLSESVYKSAAAQEAYEACGHLAAGLLETEDDLDPRTKALLDKVIKFAAGRAADNHAQHQRAEQLLHGIDKLAEHMRSVPQVLTRIEADAKDA